MRGGEVVEAVGACVLVGCAICDGNGKAAEVCTADLCWGCFDAKASLKVFWWSWAPLRRPRLAIKGCCCRQTVRLLLGEGILCEREASG